MRNLFTILIFLLPICGKAQITLAYLDSLLTVKMIGKEQYNKKVIQLFSGQIASKIETESDPVFGAHAAHGISGTNISNWNTAYGWGNHASAGYLTSFTEADPIFVAHPSFAITGTNISNWSTAFGWGNHASAGYLTSFTEADPIFIAHVAHGISGTNISNWNTAYGWGNHAGLYAALSHNHAASEITSGTLADARISSAASWNGKVDTLSNGARYLASDFTTSSVTAVNTNLSFAIGANESFVVDVYGLASKAVSSTGLKIAINGPSGCTATGFVETSSNAITTRLAYQVSAIGTLGSAFSTNIALVVPFSMHVTIVNGATPGSVTLQAATVTSNTATIYAGASMLYKKARPL